MGLSLITPNWSHACCSQPNPHARVIARKEHIMKYLYQELSSTIQAFKHCASKDANEMQQEWAGKHEETIERLVKEHMPSGSGFDCGTTVDLEASHAERLVFHTSFHHMDEMGGYAGWTEHTVTVTPSFSGFDLRISGQNRNDIKEYIHESFSECLKMRLCEHNINRFAYCEACQAAKTA